MLSFVPVLNWSLRPAASVVNTFTKMTLSSEPFHQWCLPDGTVWVSFFRSVAGYALTFPNIAHFHISKDGSSVTCDNAFDVATSTIEHLYLNQVVPLALGLQGKLIFHASAVETLAGAIAFMGVSGRGKSTLAASFAKSGNRFLTDDGLLLEKTINGYNVLPSHPSIRLWNDSREALVHKTATLAPPLQFTPKARILSDFALQFCDESRPLRRVYFLGDGSSPEISIKRMKASEALMALLSHSFLLDIEAHDVLAWHFDELTRLVELPIFFHLDYPRNYAELPQLRETILAHAANRKVDLNESL